MGCRHDDVLLVLGAVGLVDGEGLLRLQAVVHRQRGRYRLNVLGKGLGVQLQLLDPVVHGYDALHQRELDVQALGERLAVLHLAEGEQDARGAHRHRRKAVPQQNHHQQRRNGQRHNLRNLLHVSHSLLRDRSFCPLYPPGLSLYRPVCLYCNRRGPRGKGIPSENRALRAE